MKSKKPNIIFIVLDTHRVDRLGTYGYRQDISPNLDSFARQATIFQKAISPAQWTIPSHASMFTGEYPSIHNTLQSGDVLNENLTTIAEYAQREGYQTVGFCNNPLVGVLNNGFRRGFQQFYNYGGTVPSTPSLYSDGTESLVSKFKRQYFKIIDRIATPIQQSVAASPQVLKLVLNPIFVPLWTRYSNFKGDTGASIQDTTQFLKNQAGDPKFIFLNLMGTHLPYKPPREFIHKFAPIITENQDAADFIDVYNTKALQWLLPLIKSYPPIQTKALSDMYDAEVAYQDHLLGQLLEVLFQPEHRENSLIIIVGDHGEMLGEHQLMGHGIGVYDELVHVPMVIHHPSQTRGIEIDQPVSTTRVFHTVLEAMGVEMIDRANGVKVSIAETSLKNSEQHHNYVISEAFPPDNLITIMEKYSRSLIDMYDCRSTRWAVYNKPYKLIRTETVQDEIFNYEEDPSENVNLVRRDANMNRLIMELENFLMLASGIKFDPMGESPTNLDDDRVMDRLRHLGYIE
jgi:arylsulfatase A-like enzyme